MKLPVIALFIAVSAMVAAVGARGGAPHPSLAGVWTLDREHSAFPADIGFDVPGTLLGQTDGPQAATGRGRRGGGGGIPTPIITESQDDAKRSRELIAELKDPAVTLTITETDTVITISASNGAMRTFHLNAKEDVQSLKDVPVATHTKWIGNKLDVTYDVEKDRVLRYDYSRASDTAPLVVEASPRDHNKGDVIMRVYTRTPLPAPGAGR